MTRPAAPNTLILRTTLRWSAVVTGILAVVGAIVGYVVGGTAGLWSALVGVVVAGLFLGLTALIVLIAGTRAAGTPAFFAIVLGGWFVKLILFVVLMLVLRFQHWVSGGVLAVSVIVAVIATLVVDIVVMARARVPYVGDDVALPGDES